jgi:hypothetical protein
MTNEMPSTHTHACTYISTKKKFAMKASREETAPC